MLWHRQVTFYSNRDKLFSSTECNILTKGLRHQIASRLNACWQTDWAINDKAKNIDTSDCPYDQRAFSPFDPTAGWAPHWVLVIYMFVVANFNALAQASYFRNQKQTNWLPQLNAGFEPRVSDTISQIVSRLKAWWQKGWAIEDQAKNLNSTAHPYDQQAFNQPNPIAVWLSNLALAIYMFLGFFSMLWHRHAIFESKGDKLSTSA